MPGREPPMPTPVPALAVPSDLTPLSRDIRQFLRFGLVGCLNTLVDLLALNCLLWLWPTRNTAALLLANSLAYAFGALNSFLLNRYWTFQRRGRATRREIARFVLAALAGVICNDLLLAGLNSVLQAAHSTTTGWLNIAKLLAIGGTVLLSYLSMRLWVFVHHPQHTPELSDISKLFSRKGYTHLMASISGITQSSTFTGNDAQTLLPRLWQKLALMVLLLISIFVHFYRLGQNGFGNLFYAAGVRSMADNLHNFFFVSYDPGGFVSVDKPPLGFWLQALSVKLFGFTPFSIFFPQALAGVLSVLVLFYLVRRHFGVTAGLLAALALALSPLSVATDRNNTIDSTLALTLLLGTWAVLLAAETGKWRWLLLSAVLVGIGFNIKMAEAYLVVPAFGLLYLLAAPRSLWIRLTQLSLALLLLLTISLSWATVVDLIPASQRPYVGSSQNNSEISLAFGYNGLDRVLGNLGFNRGTHDTSSATRQTSVTPPDQNTSPDKAAPSASETHNPASSEQHSHGGWGLFGTGAPGPLRLLNEPLGGQIAWLLPMALLGILALAWQRRPRFRDDRQQQALLLWGVWLLTTVVFFSSIPGFFHQYYMVTFVPAICALFGIGLVVMWHDYQRPGWRGWLLPLALLLTACEQVHIIHSNPAWGAWLIPLIAIPCALAALTLSVARLLAQLDLHKTRLFAHLISTEPPVPAHLECRETRLFAHLEHHTIYSRVLGPALTLGLVALLLTPAIWSVMPALQKINEHAPSAGPARQDDFGHFDNFGDARTASLVHYLLAHQGNAKFLLATPSSMSANAIILATNQPVMALGGFAGRDPILDTTQLATLVTNGTVRFFLLNNPVYMQLYLQRRFPDLAHTQALSWLDFGRSTLSTWVTQHCTTVPSSTWSPPSQSATSVTSSTQSEAGEAMVLYDCAGTR